MSIFAATLLANVSEFTSQVIWGILWGGLAVITLSLLVLMQTRWGQARPISKCVVLSIFAHLLLMTYAQVTQLFTPPVVRDSPPVNIRLSQIDFQTPQQGEEPPEVEPWDQLAMAPAPLEGSMIPLERVDVASPLPTTTGASDPPLANNEFAPWEVPLPNPQFPEETAVPAEPSASQVPPKEPAASSVAAMEMPAPQLSSTSPVTPAHNAPALPHLERIEQPTSHLAREAFETPEVHDLNRDLQMLQETLIPADLADALPGEMDQLQASTNQFEAWAHNPSSQPASAETLGGRSDVALEATLASLHGNEMQAIWAERMSARNLPLPQSPRTTLQGKPLPLIMQARGVDNPQAWLEAMGGSPEIEPAVNAALSWLAANQEKDGSWSVTRHGGGKEPMVEGHDRQGAGTRAEMGITGLATLAFLAKGHTHLEGEYRETVQRALEYLVNRQHADGSLSGQAGTFAKMYCHAMALLAISEAYAMTQDERIRPFLDRGLAYTITAQHPHLGGWRYHPGDRGDMSQFGWQVLALHSAALSGIEIDQETRARMTRFLKDASAGSEKGLASYRPGERATPTMTAEALTCRFFLGIENSEPQIYQATQYLLQHDPSRGEEDLYYWYYGTLAMYQMQDETWSAWAQTLQPRLLQSQIQDGDLAGSWNPSGRWAGYGGRVYSTAMATLCLEVYFRYLPIYRPAEEELRVAGHSVGPVSVPR